MSNLPLNFRDADSAPILGLDPSLAEAERYDADVDLSVESSQSSIFKLLPRPGDVLELGCATGALGRALTESGCTVTGIEVDAHCAALAHRYYARMLVANLNSFDLAASELGSFDAVVAADVLEHLLDPKAVLVQIRRLLRPHGCVVASLPNVAHASVRFALLEGRFDYQNLGLLDHTHIHFYTEASVRQLFQDAGYEIAVFDRLSRPYDETEVYFDASRIPTSVLDLVLEDPNALTYQFVVKALPANSGEMDQPQPLLIESRRSPSSDAQIIGALEEYVSRLEDRVKVLTEHERELQQTRDDLDRVYASRAWRIGHALTYLPARGRTWISSHGMARLRVKRIDRNSPIP